MNYWHPFTTESAASLSYPHYQLKIDRFPKAGALYGITCPIPIYTKDDVAIIA